MKQQYLEVGRSPTSTAYGRGAGPAWADSPDFLCRFKTLYVDETHWPIQVERARSIKTW